MPRTVFSQITKIKRKHAIFAGISALFGRKLRRTGSRDTSKPFTPDQIGIDLSNEPRSKAVRHTQRCLYAIIICQRRTVHSDSACSAAGEHVPPLPLIYKALVECHDKSYYNYNYVPATFQRARITHWLLTCLQRYQANNVTLLTHRQISHQKK